MRAGLMAMGLAIALGACAGTQEVGVAPATETYSGLFRQGFEQSAFYPDSGRGPWWLTYQGDLWSRIEPFMQGAGRGMAAVVRLEVEGEVSEAGAFGHVGAYERELIATRIISVEGASQAEFEAVAGAAQGTDGTAEK